MPSIKRQLNIALPKGQSTFLWGARKTGKTTYLKEHFPDSLRYDFLKTDLFLEFTKKPSLLREQLLAQPDQVLDRPIILDEIQKIPVLLDEVHWLIENKGLSFILCGSSARKLKRGQANLLGGRAWRYEMFPLTTVEIKDWTLLDVLKRGLIPDHYLGVSYKKSLRVYTQDYLKEEIFAEGLTRNLPAFSRFFEALGFTHGELINYANIARDCGVDAKTVREYFQIIIDTLLGMRVEPFKKRQSRQVIRQAAKFYFFDVGVAGSITRQEVKQEKGEWFGKKLEHLILMELVAHRSYTELDYNIHFWRTKSGQEVDFILGKGEVAIEVKGISRVDQQNIRSVKAFYEEFKPRYAYVVCNESAERMVDNVRIIPYRIFLEKLWEGKIIS